jgi:hypothetical protein
MVYAPLYLMADAAQAISAGEYMQKIKKCISKNPF